MSELQENKIKQAFVLTKADGTKLDVSSESTESESSKSNDFEIEDCCMEIENLTDLEKFILIPIAYFKLKKSLQKQTVKD